MSIAETSNEYFVSIGPRLAPETSEDLLAQDTTSYGNLNHAIDTTFHFHHINILLDNIVLRINEP